MLRERRALVAAIMALYMFGYALLCLSGPPPGWTTYLAALAGIYGLGFVGIVAGYFWARWYAIGLGIYGLVGGILGVWQIGLEPVVMFVGGTHALVSLALWGSGMASFYDGRTEWREKFHLDESGTNRLGKAVIRIGFSLPIVVAYGLAPRMPEAAGVLALAALALAVTGTYGVFRMRTWGFAALLGCAVALFASAGAALVGSAWMASGTTAAAAGSAAGLLVLACVFPFAGPAVRYLRGL